MGGVWIFCGTTHYIVIVIVDGQFAAYALKYIYNWRKDEELVRLLRSYAKQISINTMKKNWSSTSRLG